MRDPKKARERETAFDKWFWANRDAMPEHVTTMKMELAPSILTPERIRIINHLRDHGPVDSLQELADTLGRDKAAVSRDVSYLEGGLIEEERKGRRKRIRAKDGFVILY